MKKQDFYWDEKGPLPEVTFAKPLSTGLDLVYDQIAEYRARQD